MSNSEKSAEDLINEVITFIEKERELYGDFSLSGKPASPKDPVKDKSQQEINRKDSSTDNEQLSEQSSDSSAPDPALQDTSRSSSGNINTGAGSFTSQEGLFNDDETNDIYYHIDKCDTLEELEALCKKAEVLRTDLEGTQLVFGVGNPDADLMIIGEAPGEQEDEQGEPFVGKAGQLLNKILDAINFNRGDVYIANILKHRPPNNRNPKPEEREQSLPFLLRQIDLVNPKLILTVGKVAAQTMLDKKSSLSRMRGEFHDFRGKYELLATYHPAALLRNAKWKRPTWEDVQLLRKRYDELGGQP